MMPILNKEELGKLKRITKNGNEASPENWVTKLLEAIKYLELIEAVEVLTESLEMKNCKCELAKAIGRKKCDRCETLAKVWGNNK
jgi:hypothetical protein